MRRVVPVPAVAIAEAAGETLQVTLGLTDVAGQPISDPETFFTFRRLDGNRQHGDQLVVALGGTPTVFDVPAATNKVLFCEIDPRRFRFAKSPVFLGTPGPPVRKAAQLFREPAEWTPRFTRFDALLDADLYESGGLLGLFFDLFEHKFSGGTHPHDIHELLVLQEKDSDAFDLGYRLE
jgi:hypothetical protein